MVTIYRYREVGSTIFGAVPENVDLVAELLRVRPVVFSLDFAVVLWEVLEKSSYVCRTICAPNWEASVRRDQSVCAERAGACEPAILIQPKII